MANDDDPRGLIPLEALGGGRPRGHFYRVTTATDLFRGCPVTLLASGYVDASSVTAMVPILGVAWEFAGTLKRGLATNDPFLDVSDLTPPTPSSDTGDRWVYVVDDPEQEFIVQEDTGGTALTLAEVGAACDLNYRGATATAVSGNLDSGWASLELDRSGVVTTTAAPVQILRLHDQVQTDGTENAAGNFGKWVVRIVHHQRRGGAVSVVV